MPSCKSRFHTGFGVSKCHSPGPGMFWKGEDFQNGYGKVLDFCLEKCYKMDVAQCRIKHRICCVSSF